MAPSMRKIRAFLRDESGPTAVEYAVLVGMIFLACITGIMLVGQTTADSYDRSNTELESNLLP